MALLLLLNPARYRAIGPSDPDALKMSVLDQNDAGRLLRALTGELECRPPGSEAKPIKDIVTAWPGTQHLQDLEVYVLNQ